MPWESFPKPVISQPDWPPEELWWIVSGEVPIVLNIDKQELNFSFTNLFNTCIMMSEITTGHYFVQYKSPFMFIWTAYKILMDCRLMFSIWAKQQTIPSISASDSSKFQFYIYFWSFRPVFFCLFFMTRIQFPHKSSALTASFRVRRSPNEPSIAVALTLASSFRTRSFSFFFSPNGRPLFTKDVSFAQRLQSFRNEILNKLADTDVLASGCIILRDRW